MMKMHNEKFQNTNAATDKSTAQTSPAEKVKSLGAFVRPPKRILSATAMATAALVVGTGLAIGLSTPAEMASASSIAPASGPDPIDVIHEAQAHLRAENTIADSNDVIAYVEGKVDPAPLVTAVASLSTYKELEPDAVVALTAETRATAESVHGQALEVERVAAEQAAAAAAAEQARIAAEQAEAAAAQKAAKAAAQSAQAAQAPQRVAAQAASGTPDAARAIAREMAASRYGWGDSEFAALDKLWQKESGWNYKAVNKSSGATGIPQALPGSKMASAGSDWATNPATQIAWGLDYIKSRFGSPSAAWAHSQAHGWY